MAHLIGRGRNARETYPGRTGGFGAAGATLRLYGGNTLANALQQTLGGSRLGSANWGDFAQDSLNNEGALLALPGDITLAQFSVKRVIIAGGGGPIIGDADISYELLQSTDDGATWGAPGGGSSIIVTFAPNESGSKTVDAGAVVPAGALIAARAVYPTNFDPQGAEEIVYLNASTVGAA